MSIYDSRFILIYCIVFAVLFGAAMGSFLNCAAWRLAHGEAFWKGRSHCTACGHVLGVLDLIPLLSWLLLRGKCRYCGEKISVRYVLTEAAFACLTVLCLLRFDLTVVCLRNYVFLCCLFCLSLVDLEIFEIPDGCLILPAAVWAVTLPFAGMGVREILLHLLAGLIFGGGMLGLSLIMDRILHRDSLGGGDIKLFAVMGLYLGIVASLFSLMLSCILGLAFGQIRKRTGNGTEQIPFGPAIAAATGIMLLYGTGLVSWYLGLLGIA